MSKNKIISQEFDGSIITFNSDGWFNATEAAKKFGKRPVDWLALAMTRKYLTLLRDQGGYQEYLLIKTERGKCGGTWFHPSMLTEFVSWLMGAEGRVLISRAVSDYKGILDALNEFEVPDDLPDMYVYAIQEVDTGNLKIGISRDPEQRLKTLQIGNSSKLVLLATKPATRRFNDEKLAHLANQDHKIHGEWFTNKATIL